MSTLETRRNQMFPTLDAGQIGILRRFASGEPRSFDPGELVFDIGQQTVAAWLVLDGTIEVLRRDALRGESPITSQGPGQITGEVGQLAGRTALVLGRAGEAGCVALPFDSASLRALLIGSAEIGELLMRAFILRRVGLIEARRLRQPADTIS